MSIESSNKSWNRVERKVTDLIIGVPTILIAALLYPFKVADRISDLSRQADSDPEGYRAYLDSVANPKSLLGRLKRSIINCVVQNDLDINPPYVPEYEKRRRQKVELARGRQRFTIIAQIPGGEYEREKALKESKQKVWQQIARNTAGRSYPVSNITTFFNSVAFQAEWVEMNVDKPNPNDIA